MKRLMIICGPTATGKTELGINLAKKFKGEIISADSRQVYRGMDVGTGKEINQSSIFNPPAGRAGFQFSINDYTIGYHLVNKIPIWLLDVCEPNQEFSAAHFVEFAIKVIEEIWGRRKLPIIVGGTGFWIKALIDDIDSLGIPPDWRLRKKLRNYETKKLREILNKLDPEKLGKMNQADRNNPRRLVRAIEIKKSQISNPCLIGRQAFFTGRQAFLTGRQVKTPACSCLEQQRPAGRQNQISNLKTDKLLMIGLKTRDYQSLYKRIDERVERRVKEGVIREIKALLKKGYSWNLPAFSATGYRLWQDYFESRKSLKDIIQRWKYEEHGLARRQLTYFRAMEKNFARKKDITAIRSGEIHFKKDKRIKWFNVDGRSYKSEIEKQVGEWYSKASH